MALSLGVHEQDVIYIGDTPLMVKSLNGHKNATVEVDGKELVLSDEESVEVLPNVMVSCGAPREDKRERNDVLPRLLFDAPMSVVILRKDLYERAKK